jgi:hypothetical protein
MVLLSLPGFCLSASFLSIIYLEQPYYLVLLTVGILKLATKVQIDCGNAAPEHIRGPSRIGISPRGGQRRPQPLTSALKPTM